MLSFLLKVGDTVVMNMSSDQRDARTGKWSPNGTVGKVVKKSRYLQYVERLNAYNDKPIGVYERNGANHIKWADKPEPEFECYNLAPFDVAAWTKFEQETWHTPRENGENISAIEDKARETVRVGDLPEHKFYEWDIVRITEPGYGQGWAKINSVLYHNFKNGVPCYDVQFLDNNFQPRGGSSYVDETLMEEGKRGPTWCEFHNLPYEFEDEVARCAYEKARGRYEEVRNPYSGAKNYYWSIDEAARAIHDDIGDCIMNVGVPFGSGKKLSVGRFTNREIGEAIRQKTIPGFSQQKYKTA